MKVALASSSLVAVPTLELLQDSGIEVLAGLTRPDAHAGRGRSLLPNPFANYVESKGLRILKPDNAASLHEALQEVRPDLVITIAYGRLIRESELMQPKYGWINLHFSLLPKFRGAAPVQRAILAGERRTGLTVFQLDRGMDSGSIYVQREISLAGNENSGEVLSRLSEIGAPAVLEAIAMIDSGISPLPQDETLLSFAPKIDKSETKIVWNLSTIEIDRLVRAFSPSPGAWTEFRGQRLVISQALPSTLEKKQNEEPGTFLVEDERICIATRDGYLEIKRLIPSGKREMLASDWARGARISALEKVQ